MWIWLQLNLKLYHQVHIFIVLSSRIFWHLIFSKALNCVFTQIHQSLNSNTLMPPSKSWEQWSSLCARSVPLYNIKPFYIPLNKSHLSHLRQGWYCGLNFSSIFSVIHPRYYSNHLMQYNLPMVSPPLSYQQILDLHSR